MQYETIARAYERLFPPNPACAAELRAALRGFSAPPGSAGAEPAFIDLGCATGSLVRDVASWGAPSLGVDPEPAMIAQARESAAGLPLARFEVGGMEDLPRFAPPGSLALVACLGNTVPHLGDTGALRAFFYDCFRALAPGGSLYVQVVNYAPALAAGTPVERAFPESRGEGFSFRRSWRLDGREVRFTFAFEDEKGVSTQAIRLMPFTLGDLVAAAEAARFEGALAASAWGGAPFIPETSEFLIMKARKPV
jgi:SAM-dependent methyltransferase